MVEFTIDISVSKKKYTYSIIQQISKTNTLYHYPESWCFPKSSASSPFICPSIEAGMMGQTFHDIRPLHQLSRGEHGGTLEKPPENCGKMHFKFGWRSLMFIAMIHDKVV